MHGEQLTIVVSGMLAGTPYQGGATWAVLQYLLGLRALGHRVMFIEPISNDGISTETAFRESASAQYFHQVTRSFRLDSCAAMILCDTRTTVGLPFEDLLHCARNADLLLNISGMLREPAIFEAIPCRAYLDLDPAFNQLWHTQGVESGFSGHTHFITIGTAIGRPSCTVPTCDREWIKTLQPIVLEEWPFATTLQHNSLTTVGNWRGYGSVEYQGTQYGQKAHSLRQFFDLPRRTREKFELALAIDPGETKDLEALDHYGWQIIDPSQVAETPQKYQAFVQGSKAELGISKTGYVHSRCGWFSDRSIAYLASGRPVIAQSTGFEDDFPVGEGLLVFRTIDDVLAAIDALNHDYQHHRTAARALAEDYFSSAKVLSRLLDELGSTAKV